MHHRCSVCFKKGLVRQLESCEHIMCVGCAYRRVSCDHPSCRSQREKQDKTEKRDGTNTQNAPSDVHPVKLKRYPPLIVEKCQQLIALIEAYHKENLEMRFEFTMKDAYDEYYEFQSVVENFDLSISDASKIVEYYGLRRALILYEHVQDERKLGRRDGLPQLILALAHEVLRACICEFLGIYKFHLEINPSSSYANEDDSDDIELVRSIYAK